VQQATRESPIKGKTEERHEAAPRVRSLHEKDDFRGSQLFSAGFQCDSRKYRYFQTPLKLKLISAVFFVGPPKNLLSTVLNHCAVQTTWASEISEFLLFPRPAGPLTRARPVTPEIPPKPWPHAPRAATFHLHEPQTGTAARARPAQ
jgi:hypothetical protein